MSFIIKHPVLCDSEDILSVAQLSPACLDFFRHKLQDALQGHCRLGEILVVTLQTFTLKISAHVNKLTWDPPSKHRRGGRTTIAEIL